MNKLLKKEMRLTASPLTYFFIAATILTLVPGYPILCGAFFVCLGIFQTFQSARESNDIVYSALLPVAKCDVVKGKYIFSVCIELISFAVTAALTLIRMTVLSDAGVYLNNALMTANPFFLGAVLVIFGLFNRVFIAGFFKTAYKFAKSFITFIIMTFVFITAAEALHHIPGFSAVNAFGFDSPAVQFSALLAGAAVFALLTMRGISLSVRRFEAIDL